MSLAGLARTLGFISQQASGGGLWFILTTQCSTACREAGRLAWLGAGRRGVSQGMRTEMVQVGEGALVSFEGMAD